MRGRMPRHIAAANTSTCRLVGVRLHGEYSVTDGIVHSLDAMPPVVPR